MPSCDYQSNHWMTGFEMT